MGTALCRALLLMLPAAGAAAPLHVQVLDPVGEGVDGVVVYLDGPGEASPPGPPVEAGELVVRQQERKFAPYFGVLPRGGRAVFTNEDRITHHVYSFNGPERFSFHLNAGDGREVREFPTAGVYAMGCNIHDWMSAYLLVVDTPWFAFTGSGGWASFADLPPGDYTVTAWHPQMREEKGVAAELSHEGTGRLTLRLARDMKEIPRQEGLADFDFLEEY